MVHCGPSAVRRLNDILGKEHPEDHWTAIEELRRSKTPPSVALPYMMHLFTVLEPTQLLQAMASFDESGREAYRILDRWSQDADASVRRLAREVHPHVRDLFGDPID
jgi:DNA topoisomerase IB